MPPPPQPPPEDLTGLACEHFFVFTQGILQMQVKCQVWNVPRLPSVHRQDEKPEEAKEAGIQDQEEWEWVSAQCGLLKQAVLTAGA